MASTVFDAVLQSGAYQSAKKNLIDSLKKELAVLQRPKPAAAELKKNYDELVSSIEKGRGRELFYKFVPSGAGSGPLIELADGSVKYDLITGIGVNFFGHGNLELFEAQLDGTWGEVMQGNLGPNRDHLALTRALLDAVPKTRLKNVWITTCGATANEIALKIIRQKKAPATKIFTFEHAFAGRTTALQEITDNPKYREGQPVYGEVSYLPFFSAGSKMTAAGQGAEAAALMRKEIARYPGKFAGFVFEIVQGEGGFNVAPREFLAPILDEARKQGLAVWADEIQTFGRTGEVFCFQRLGLDEYIDVVTAAKLLQAGAVMYAADYNPKAGLISGTFSSASSAIRSGIKVMEILRARMTGPSGRVRKLEAIALEELARIKAGPAGKHVPDHSVFGGMIAFSVFDGTLDTMKKFLFRLWDLGVIAFYCGHGPYRARMLAPFGVMTDEQLRHVFSLTEQAIAETAREIKP